MQEENPFNNLPINIRQEQSLINVEQSRAVAEVQSAMTIAKRFPRDQREAMDRILTACTRPTLAEKAVYAYSRGGTDISGPSVNLAKAIAQNWGNMQYGVRELSQANGESTVESYAWDIETNTREGRTFQVPHTRYSRAKGNTKLSDPRDIYELIANQGARRLRACILGIVPGDVVDAAVKQCEQTLRTKINITPELIQSLVDKFAEFKITKAMLEARIQRRIDAITPALSIQLGKIYNSLKDGMGQPSDWFDVMADFDGESNDPELFYKIFTDIINTENTTFEILDTFVGEVAKKHKLQPEAVKDGAMKDPAKFGTAFKKYLAKQVKPKPEENVPPDMLNVPVEKHPILCPSQKKGVAPEECSECASSKKCDQYASYLFDQKQGA